MAKKRLDEVLKNHSEWLMTRFAMQKHGECADLRGADLCDADLRDADLRGAEYNEYTAFFAIQCPEYGSFIGWKRADKYIVKIQITESALRSSATSRKCRCSEALVLAIEKFDGTDSGLSEIRSNYDSGFIYRVGEIVKVSNFCEDRWTECTTGIHFFITRQEAINYI